MDEQTFVDGITSRFYTVQEKYDLNGEWYDYSYTAITDKKTGKLMYRIDNDGAPVGSKPIYLDVQ
jgi:hypothetical protein